MKLKHDSMKSLTTVSSVGSIVIDAYGFAEVSEVQAAHLTKLGFRLVHEAPHEAPPPAPVVVVPPVEPVKVEQEVAPELPESQMEAATATMKKPKAKAATSRK